MIRIEFEKLTLWNIKSHSVLCFNSWKIWMKIERGNANFLLWHFFHVLHVISWYLSPPQILFFFSLTSTSSFLLLILCHHIFLSIGTQIEMENILMLLPCTYPKSYTTTTTSRISFLFSIFYHVILFVGVIVSLLKFKTFLLNYVQYLFSYYNPFSFFFCITISIW